MTPDTTISLALICSVASVIFVAANFFSNRRKDIKSDNEGLLKANMKLDQICATTNETRSDIKSINSQIKDITEEQIKQRMEISTMWKRVDELKEKLERMRLKDIERSE